MTTDKFEKNTSLPEDGKEKQKTKEDGESIHQKQKEETELQDTPVPVCTQGDGNVLLMLLL